MRNAGASSNWKRYVSEKQKIDQDKRKSVVAKKRGE
jgi:hypothetical protein